PRSSSAACTSSTPRISTKRWRGPRRFPALAAARSRSDPSWTCLGSRTYRGRSSEVNPAARALDRIFRAEAGAVLATLIRVLGDFQLAEDALQDALAAALEVWPKQGLPASPAAWLTTAARRKAITHLRHDKVVESKRAALSTFIEEQADSDG